MPYIPLVISSLGCVVISFLLSRLEKKSGLVKRVVLKLEFSHSPETVKNLLANANEHALNYLRLNTFLDFFFIIGYTSVFIYAAAIVQGNYTLFSSLPAWLPFVWIVPGACDCIENIFLLGFLRNEMHENQFSLYLSVVRVKWILIIPGVLVALAGIFIALCKYLF